MYYVLLFDFYSPMPNFSATMVMTPPNVPGSVGGIVAMPLAAIMLDFFTSCWKCGGKSNAELLVVIALLIELIGNSDLKKKKKKNMLAFNALFYSSVQTI